MAFKKTDLKFSEYSWTALNGDNPKISGEPDNTLLSRKEGYEVLYFINKTMEKRNWIHASSGHRIEKMIHEHVPKNIHSQIEIYNWIIANW
ncbi:MAG: hypothetical protein JNJ58_12425 [Chitinophagaceae bacterium]|nr:hypothetical protein [Chitinophagaceae bacterium]